MNQVFKQVFSERSFTCTVDKLKLSCVILENSKCKIPFLENNFTNFN